MTENDQTQRPTVAVVGGGYGGVRVAKALDETMDVVLIEPKDAFMHNIAALRALVDPSWLPKIYMPYAKVLANGRVVRDRAALVDPGRVVTASGQEILADYVVLATGSSYAFPAKTDKVDTEAAHDQVRAAHAALSQADRVLLLGAGPVGIELAGEIEHVWPEKSVTLLDVAGEVLGGPFKPELKAELRRQLAEKGVEVLLGSPLRELPPTDAGELGTFTVTTEEGSEITADIWFRCFGVVPNSDYLGEALLSARQPDGFVQVEPTLQVIGQTTVFALGDLSTADAKMAAFANLEAETVAANITALANGSEPTAYQPMGSGIVVPIGPLGGAGQFPGQDEILGPDTVADLKGRDMGVDRFQELFGLAVAAAD
ncbi:MAG: apoptosis-inducing factor 2 [Acidimicrobiaceae bacterium]|nr:apoptosis-inducing factor 2 [Acidimicrobiaceae bacterium]